jgi:Tol biopolymer transport system component
MKFRGFPLILLGCLLAAAPLAGAQLVSLNASGTAAGNAGSFNASLSANGRFVAFESQATDLVPGGTSGENVFVRDLLTGITVLASVNEPPYVGGAEFPHLSADGRYVAYQRSTCTSSPFCPTNDVFVRDLQTATTTLVSVAQDGGPGGGFHPVISADGRHVAFTSGGGNLVPGDANGTSDVFVRDLDAGTTRLASVNAAGTGSGNGPSRNPALSADGRFVAFESDAGDLAAGDGNGTTDVFFRDLQSGPTLLVSVNAAGTGSGNGISTVPTISADGSRVAFGSGASDLVPADTNGSPDVFVRDLPAGPTRLVSIDAAGTDSGNSTSGRPYLTPSGRFVAFESDANDLAAGDDNSSQDVFLRDVDAGVTRLVSVNASGTSSAGGYSELFLALDTLAGFQVASDDGRFVVFGSAAQDLVSGVSYPCDVSPCFQVYRRDLQAGTTSLLSATPAGDAAGNRGDSGFSTGGQISADGRVAIFQSTASNLSTQPDTNNANDIFSVGAPQAPAMPVVPALSEAGLALLALLMAGLGLRAIRK